MTKNIFHFVALLSLILLFACEKEPSTIPVSSVSLDNTSLTLTEGWTAPLIATISPSNATNKNVVWSSSDETVATVKNGVVTAVKQGFAKITVRTEDGGKTATCSIVVEPKNIAVSGITLDKTSFSMYDDEEVTLIATIAPENATEKTVNWKSSDESVATVAGGKVTAHKEGSTDITASVENVSAKCVITVKKRVIHVEVLSLSTKHKRLKIGESFTIDCSVYPSNANDYELTYKSDDESIARVSNDGVITAIRSGKTTIKVTAERKSAELSISVFKADDVFFSYNVYDYGTFTSFAYKNEEELYEATGLDIKDIFVNDSQNPIFVATEQTYPMRSTVIEGGNRYYLKDIDNSNAHHIECSWFDNNTLYHVVNYPLPIVNGGYAIWVGYNKKYDISESGELSPYAYINVFDITVMGGDVYTCGSITEPVDDKTNKRYPVIWKNGKIFKKIESEAGASFHQVVNANGKLYFLMASIVESKHLDYVSIWDKNGKCYDIGTSDYATAGKLYWFGSKLYTTVNNSGGLSVYESNKKVFEIKGVEMDKYDMDYLDGDIYSFVVKREMVGGMDYSSAYLYRNDVVEKVIVKPQIYPIYSGGIKALAKD